MSTRYEVGSLSMSIGLLGLPFFSPVRAYTHSKSADRHLRRIFDLDASQPMDDVVHVQNPLQEEIQNKYQEGPPRERQAQHESESQTIQRATMYSQVTAPRSNPKREMRRSSITPKANTPTTIGSSDDL